MRHARRARRRRPLREDGAQRHRVRRHAAHRRGVGRAAARPRDDGAGDGRRLRRWNAGPLESFLGELTAKVCRTIDPETGQPLVDVVLDKAGQKGTGKLDGAGRARPGRRDPDHRRGDRCPRAVEHEGRARRGGAASCPALARGRLPRRGSEAGDRRPARRAVRRARLRLRAGHGAHPRRLRRYKWNVNLAEIGRIWKGGCIIRARLLDPVRHAFGTHRRS